MNPDIPNKQQKAILGVSAAFIEAVRASGDLGSPGGHLYAIAMEFMSLEEFEAFMGGIVATGILRKEGQVYYYVGRKH